MTHYGPIAPALSPDRSPDLIALLPRLQARARALTRCPAHAEDLAQDCAAKLWLCLQRGDQIDDLEPYAMMTLRHLAVSAWRRQPDEDPLEDDSATTPPDAMARLILRDVQAAMADLPPEQAAVMRFVLRGETSPAVIARALALPKGTVMSRLSRARAKLRVVMSDTL